MMQEKILFQLTIAGDPVAHQRPRLGRGYIYTPQKSRKYKELVALHIRSKYKQEQARDGKFGLKAAFYRSNKQRIDIDNLVKSLMDAITLAGVWKDDSQLQELTAEIFLANKEPRVDFTLYLVPDNSPAKKCRECGIPIKSYRSDKVTFCSVQCNIKNKSATQKCVVCGKIFTMAASKIKIRKRQVCSRECYFKWKIKEHKGKPPKNKCQLCGGRVSKRKYTRCRVCYTKLRRGDKSNYWKEVDVNGEKK